MYWLHKTWVKLLSFTKFDEIKRSEERNRTKIQNDKD